MFTQFFYLSPSKVCVLISWRCFEEEKMLRNKTIKISRNGVKEGKRSRELAVDVNCFERNSRKKKYKKGSQQRHKIKFICEVKSAGKLKLNAFISLNSLFQYLTHFVHFCTMFSTNVNEQTSIYARL